MKQLLKRPYVIIALLTLSAFIIALVNVAGSPAALFLRPDQAAWIWMQKKDYPRAARLFTTPMWRGTAQYRAGQFKAAAATFSQDDSADAFYNRGNALLMTGNYPAAISAYQQALSKRANWREARDNLALARKRQQLLQKSDEAHTGEEGLLPPDEIVFDKQLNTRQQETVSSESQAPSDTELRALWLRRVQTRPEDFLRAKFSYQVSQTKKPHQDKSPVPAQEGAPDE